VPPDDDVFGVTYGDGVCDVDFRRCSHSTDRTESWRRDRGCIRLGSSASSRSARATPFATFHEKPPRAEGWISGGFFVVFPRAPGPAVRLIPSSTSNAPCSSRWRARGELIAYQHEGFWSCVEYPARLPASVDAVAEGAPWAVWDQPRD